MLAANGAHSGHSITSDSFDGAVCDEKVRLHGLDLSTKQIADNSREP